MARKEAHDAREASRATWSLEPVDFPVDSPADSPGSRPQPLMVQSNNLGAGSGPIGSVPIDSGLGSYVVQEGESIDVVAMKFDMRFKHNPNLDPNPNLEPNPNWSVPALVKLNGLPRHPELKTGQILEVKEQTVANPHSLPLGSTPQHGLSNISIPVSVPGQPPLPVSPPGSQVRRRQRWFLTLTLTLFGSQVRRRQRWAERKASITASSPTSPANPNPNPNPNPRLLSQPHLPHLPSPRSQYRLSLGYM